MPETKKTFPRIEVRGEARPSYPDWTNVELFYDKDQTDILRSGFSRYADACAAVDSYRNDPRAGDCCPVYDYAKDIHG